ncbi:GNAT family N-acetyltransferase [Paraglaciecola sp. L3A3]|uniref:GNAT family N-acetyltransferase n=1 Tax=Paraglaciecola sp. L3A3 TaxID=2686358 RepID=UPI00131CAC15|nr:GNAT family N-acetyltransferase [Paraglaciecola sp. L3A3]
MLAIDTVPHSHHIIDGTEITIRPFSPADIKLEEDFFHNLSPITKYFRFMEGIRDVSPAMLKQLCDIDGKHSMAFIATIKGSNGEIQIGVSRYACGTSETESEMAITVADQWQHKEIEILLMKPLLEYAKNNGLHKLYFYEFSENTAIRKLAKELGMTTKADPDDPQLVTYSLHI